MPEEEKKELEAKQESTVEKTPDVSEKAEQQDADTAKESESLKLAIEELSGRVSRIEELLDSLSEEEENENSPEAELAKEEEKKPEEGEAKHSKELSAVKDELVTLRAEFRKLTDRLENTGTRRTVQSSSPEKKTELQMAVEEMKPVLAGMGMPVRE